MFKKLFIHLANRGYDPYSIGQHTGICSEPYLVIKERGEAPFLSSLTAKYVDITVFYPLGSYSDMDVYVSGVQDALADLREMRNTHIMTPTVVDNRLQAYTVSMTYQIIVRRRV